MGDQMQLEVELEPDEVVSPPRPVPRKVTVTDGPFAETKELVGGSWEDSAVLTSR
jgi:hypothetical protein